MVTAAGDGATGGHVVEGCRRRNMGDIQRRAGSHWDVRERHPAADLETDRSRHDDGDAICPRARKRSGSWPTRDNLKVLAHRHSIVYVRYQDSSGMVAVWYRIAATVPHTEIIDTTYLPRACFPHHTLQFSFAA
uniref:Uncharacterized protein n=1 Tax=Timema monikensis TaxID=170555 RepID=A0A7R9HRQ1_9NEOP|nr:unnamed protein product [Timema monikensis]